MREFQFKIGRQLFHFGENGLMRWNRTAASGTPLFDDVEV